MEFEKIQKEGFHYWVWTEEDFLPYAWPSEKDIRAAPKPLMLRDLHPDYPMGFEYDDQEEAMNVSGLGKTFEEIRMDNDLRKDLRRVEKKNAETELVQNEKNSLEMSSHWFLEQWKEDEDYFQRRLSAWKKISSTLSAYLKGELIGVHISMKEKNFVYYLGCWWNRGHKNLSVPTFLLKKDIENAIVGGFKQYDLGVGDEPYKKRWGVAQRPAKYYAEMTPETASKLGVKRFVKNEKID